MMRMRRLGWIFVLSGIVLKDSTGAPVRPVVTEEQLADLRAEVRALRADAIARFQADTLLAAVVEQPNAIVVGLRVATVREILSNAAARYLSAVRLHLRLNEVVREQDDVRVRIGPVRVNAGRWELAVTIQRVDALLSARSIDLVVTDSARIDLKVPVDVRGGTGEALIDFKWDAARVTSLVCRDFQVREKFSGYVEPRTYRMSGHFDLISDGNTTIARPIVHERISVSPQPTEASWARVREILGQQNRIFNCGLALSPSSLEQKIRGLLTKGFRFSLPSSILRPIPLPASILNEVDVGGRRAALTIVPIAPRLGADWLWLSARVNATGYGDAPIRLDAPR